ncbi:DUF4832 domain-containing protein [Clostridium botulinum]|nr:DUF4832 domain-containing protein [Clostridium botulinum]
MEIMQSNMKLKIWIINILLIIIIGIIVIMFLHKKIIGVVTKDFKINEFKESNRVITNPYMGLVMDATSESAEEPFSTVYAGISWRELEPQKGKFNFDAVEKKIRYKHWKKDKSYVIRVYMDYPSSKKHMDIPDWLYKEIKGKGVWYDKDGNKGFAPEYNNPVLINYHSKLIKALGKRYNKDKSVVFVEIGSIGQWGEWNNSISDKDNKFPGTSITDKYVIPYIQYLGNKFLLMRRPFEIAKKNKMGLFNDSFGDKFQTNDYFLSWINNGYKVPDNEQHNPEMRGYWEKRPSAGEFANYPGDMYLENKNIESTINMIKNSHTTWLGPSNPGYVKLPKEKKKNLDRLLNIIGYRYTITRIQYSYINSPGQSLIGSISIKNSGVAPFYFKWPIQLILEGPKGKIVQKQNLNYDIRNLLPGNVDIPFQIPLNKNLPSGIYKVKVCILNPETNKPAIEFANFGCKNSKVCNVGEMKVK